MKNVQINPQTEENLEPLELKSSKNMQMGDLLTSKLPPLNTLDGYNSNISNSQSLNQVKPIQNTSICSHKSHCDTETKIPTLIPNLNNHPGWHLTCQPKPNNSVKFNTEGISLQKLDITENNLLIFDGEISGALNHSKLNTLQNSTSLPKSLQNIKHQNRLSYPLCYQMTQVNNRSVKDSNSLASTTKDSPISKNLSKQLASYQNKSNQIVYKMSNLSHFINPQSGISSTSKQSLNLGLEDNLSSNQSNNTVSKTSLTNKSTSKKTQNSPQNENKSISSLISSPANIQLNGTQSLTRDKTINNFVPNLVNSSDRLDTPKPNTAVQNKKRKMQSTQNGLTSASSNQNLSAHEKLFYDTLKLISLYPRSSAKTRRLLETIDLTLSDPELTNKKTYISEVIDLTSSPNESPNISNTRIDDIKTTTTSEPFSCTQSTNTNNRGSIKSKHNLIQLPTQLPTQSSPPLTADLEQLKISSSTEAEPSKYEKHPQTILAVESELFNRLNIKDPIAITTIEPEVPNDLEEPYITSPVEYKVRKGLKPLFIRLSQLPTIIESTDPKTHAGVEYEVDCIIGRRINEKGHRQYLIKWKGYHIDLSSWVNLPDIDGTDLIDVFNASLESTKGGKISRIANPKYKEEYLPDELEKFLILLNQDEDKTISVVNDVDECPAPTFTYINTLVLDTNVRLDTTETNLLKSCGCLKNCKFLDRRSPRNYCMRAHDLVSYNVNGTLQKTDLTTIHECNTRCKCNLKCPNRVTQRGRDINLQVFRTQKKGWGVKTLQDIPNGTFVCKYAGLVITSDKAEELGIKYDSMGITYLFDFDNFISDEKFPDLCADACSYGNISRFINHSCNPNMKVFSVIRDYYSLYDLAFFSTRDITKGEELFIDYSGGNEKDLPNKKMRSECHCESLNCRGFLYM